MAPLAMAAYGITQFGLMELLEVRTKPTSQTIPGGV
jgi:hypothetical protein